LTYETIFDDNVSQLYDNVALILLN